MTMVAKILWDNLAAESEIPFDQRAPGFGVRIEAAMTPVYELLKAFERERAHQPFRSQAPCPVCDTGTVTYHYQAPLIGNMKCDSCDYVRLNL